MYIVDTNLATAVISMSNEDGSFPGANALDTRPKNIARATSTTSLIIIRSAGNILTFFNSLATSGNLDITDVTAVTNYLDKATVSVSSTSQIDDSANGLGIFSPGDEIVVQGFSTSNNNGKFTIATVDGGGAFLTVSGTPLSIEGAPASADIIDVSTPTVTTAIASLPGAKSEYYEKISASEYTDVVVELTLTHTSLNVELGLFFMGNMVQYGVSDYGRADSPMDTSIRVLTAAGNQVARPRDILRNLDVPVKCTVAQRKSLERLLVISPDQDMVFISNPDTDDVTQYMRYGRTILPRASQDKPDRRTVQLRITESV
jgi:hypothetical protein